LSNVGVVDWMTVEHPPQTIKSPVPVIPKTNILRDPALAAYREETPEKWPIKQKSNSSRPVVV